MTYQVDPLGILTAIAIDPAVSREVVKVVTYLNHLQAVRKDWGECLDENRRDAAIDALYYINQYYPTIAEFISDVLVGLEVDLTWRTAGGNDWMDELGGVA